MFAENCRTNKMQIILLFLSLLYSNAALSIKNLKNPTIKATEDRVQWFILQQLLHNGKVLDQLQNGSSPRQNPKGNKQQLVGLAEKLDGLAKQNGRLSRQYTDLATENEKVKNMVKKLEVKFSAMPSDNEYDGYIGCFQDCKSRMLKSKYVSNIGDLTLKKCKHICKGYKYLGLQFSVECWCGNEIKSNVFPRLPEERCNMPCTGNKKRMCGGACSNSVYTVNNSM